MRQKLWKMLSSVSCPLFTYLLAGGKITVIIGVVDHHGPVMKVCRQNKGLTEDPVNHCGHLWFAPVQQLSLTEVDVVPGGESSVKINLIAVVSPGTDVVTTAHSQSAVFKPWD